VALSFNEQFDQHGAWRREFASRLKLLSEWLKDHDLLDSAVEERLRRLESQMRTDKVMVAFVAEFSRGKSELINAIFFAGYKRRIMPASAGRTTMCPDGAGLRPGGAALPALLPIETRLHTQPLMEWRMVPEKWHRVDLDVNDPGQLAQAFEKGLGDSPRAVEEAKALGFWHEDAPEDNPMVHADGLVEVPRWRHALINIAHPLLKQGLVILDTPGLNAIGAEPELTVNLIPQAHAVVFILAADTGVTKSDLAIWREHLIAEDSETSSRLVVLNKIDTDVGRAQHALPGPGADRSPTPDHRRSPGHRRTPGDPGVGQKGLVAKVNNDANCSRPATCRAGAGAGQGVMGQRQKILRASVGPTSRTAHRRRRASRHPPARPRRADGGAEGPARQEHVGHQAHARAHRAGAGRLRRQRRQDPRRALGPPQAAARRVRPAGHRDAQDRDGASSPRRCASPASSWACARPTAAPSTACARACARPRRSATRSRPC
jgi:hypothetical protein